MRLCVLRINNFENIWLIKYFFKVYFKFELDYNILKLIYKIYKEFSKLNFINIYFYFFKIAGGKKVKETASFKKYIF